MNERSLGVGLIVIVLGVALVTGCAGSKKEPIKAPELTTTEKRRKANSMLGVGRAQEALALLEDALEDEPENTVIHLEYGSACFAAGRFPEAEAAFLRALEIDPYSTEAHNFLGAVYDQMGRKADAESQWKLALTDPSYPTPEKVYLNLGALYASQGRDAEAIQHIRRSVEINPKFYVAHYKLASLLARTGKLEEAAREFVVAAPDFRNSGEYHYRLGFTYFQLKDFVRARESLLRVLSVAPGSPSAERAGNLLKMMD